MQRNYTRLSHCESKGGASDFPQSGVNSLRHICISNVTIIGLDYGLSPGRHQAILWSNAWILLTRSLLTNFSEILIVFQRVSFKENAFEMVVCKIKTISSRPECVMTSTGAPMTKVTSRVYTGAAGGGFRYYPNDFVPRILCVISIELCVSYIEWFGTWFLFLTLNMTLLFGVRYIPWRSCDMRDYGIIHLTGPLVVGVM